MGPLLRHVLFPVWHWAKRDGVNRAIRQLEENQWLPAADLLDLQQRKLARLVAFASANVPYYRTVFRELGIPGNGELTDSDFLRVPVLTKGIIRREKNRMISEDLAGNRLRSNSTSGSTGEAVRFFTDARSLPYRQASLIRSDSWTGWRLGEKVARIWGARIDEKKASSLRGTLHRLVTDNRFLSSFDLSAAKMDSYINIIRDFKPRLIVAYPGPLEEFAIHCGNRGVSFPSLRAIVSSAETLWPHQREIIEEAFGVRIFNRYGSREVAHIGSECEFHEGLHLSVDRLLVEVVDDEGRRCEPGEAGRILVTDLDNFGMPLIRYDIGDLGAIAASARCRCGRGLPMLEKIEGRTLDIIRTPRGRQVGGTFWTLLLRSRPGLRQFQVVQDTLDGIVVNFIRDEGFEPGVLAYFTDKIQENCGRELRVDFVEKESLDLTGSGKRRLIVSRVGSSGGGSRGPD